MFSERQICVNRKNYVLKTLLVSLLDLVLGFIELTENAILMVAMISEFGSGLVTMRMASDEEEKDTSFNGMYPECGAIFMSNIATKDECFSRRLFGLPSSKGRFVEKVKTGMILFLFEYERRELHGVFQARSDGELNIFPYAYNSSGKQFPAQVKVTPIWRCRPLNESEFRDAIKENYFSKGKFNFGLSKDQVRRLLTLFSSRKIQEQWPKSLLDTSKKGRPRHKFRKVESLEGNVPVPAITHEDPVQEIYDIAYDPDNPALNIPCSPSVWVNHVHPGDPDSVDHNEHRSSEGLQSDSLNNKSEFSRLSKPLAWNSDTHVEKNSAHVIFEKKNNDKSVDEVMAMLNESHYHWMKSKKSKRPRLRNGVEMLRNEKQTTVHSELDGTCLETIPAFPTLSEDEDDQMRIEIPFVDFKRRSELRKVNGDSKARANDEIAGSDRVLGGQHKRRKLSRPNFNYHVPCDDKNIDRNASLILRVSPQVSCGSEDSDGRGRKRFRPNYEENRSCDNKSINANTSVNLLQATKLSHIRRAAKEVAICVDADNHHGSSSTSLGTADRFDKQEPCQDHRSNLSEASFGTVGCLDKLNPSKELWDVNVGFGERFFLLSAGFKNYETDTSKRDVLSITDCNVCKSYAIGTSENVKDRKDDDVLHNSGNGNRELNTAYEQNTTHEFELGDDDGAIIDIKSLNRSLWSVLTSGLQQLKKAQQQ